jgi:D-glycero-alpha-D-manno-heptose-7-phosphate kinase
MILSTAPMRITLGGGGTDLESYYSKYGGFLIAGAVNKYCTIVANRRFVDTIRISYSEMENVNSVEDIKHRIFKTALKFMEVKEGIELHSIADIPSRSGLGTSSTFTVSLLNALHTYKKDYITQKQLADEACHVEIDLLGEPIGKQDQYMAAFGGLTCLTFCPNGDVGVEPLRVKPDIIDQIESNLLLFFTGKERDASDILLEQDQKSKTDDPHIISNLHTVKDIGLQTRKYLEAGEVDMLGELFHVHWETKKMRSKNMSDPFIDDCYELARKKGALGGKLVGAGGGGFLMFYCANGCKSSLIECMQSRGLKWERFHFDFTGAKILVNT